MLISEFKKRTTLMSAAHWNNTDKALALIDRGEDPVNAQDIYGRTALHYAAENGNMKVINALLAKGADRSLKDMWQQTAARKAAFAGHKMAAALLEGQAPADRKAHLRLVWSRP